MLTRILFNRSFGFSKSIAQSSRFMMNDMKSGFFKNQFRRYQNNPRHGFSPEQKLAVQTTKNYMLSIIITFVGLSIAAVPLYQLFCTTTGTDGTPKTGAGTKFLLANLNTPLNARPIKIAFDSSVSDSLDWTFVPEHQSITVLPGDTALSFFKAKNNTDKPVIGLSTYSVVPYKAAQYFNKVQCFCFEEQRLEAGEEVEMPVFFFIDPEFSVDPWMKDVNEITLHYTFFKSKNQDNSQ